MELATQRFVAVGVKAGAPSVAAARWAAEEASARELDLVLAHGYSFPFADPSLPADALAVIQTGARNLVAEVRQQSDAARAAGVPDCGRTAAGGVA